MNNMLYILIIILLIVWALGYFVWLASGAIHLLLVIVVVVIILRLLRRNKPN